MTMETNKKSQSRSMPAPAHYAFKYLLNPLMKRILRSRAHSLVSDNLLLLTFRGRKSGRAYTTPVSYVQEGETLLLMTESPWWRNLEGGADVTVQLRGQARRGRATAEAEPEATAQVFERALKAHGPAYLRRRYRVNLKSNDPAFAELVEAAEGTVLITVDLVE
jgi:deazaflavin-dependent oxidoreductase (nitroreductase family)